MISHHDAQEIERAITTLVERDAGALLVGSGPFLFSNLDVILAGGTEAALAAKRATSVIPIVFPSAGDYGNTVLVVGNSFVIIRT